MSEQMEVEENRITAERERMRESERALTVERILALARYGIQISFFDAGALTAEEFDERLTTAYLDGEAAQEQALRPERERLTAWVEAVTRPDPPAVTSDEALKIAAYAGRQFSDLRDRLFKAIGLMGEKP